VSQATAPSQTLPDLALLRARAGLLQRLEASRLRVSADQYRSVARQLAQALSDVHADATLHALLDAHPAAAEIYENQNYRHAGLCRCPLELALWSEFLAREVLQFDCQPSTPALPVQLAHRIWALSTWQLAR
jgi:hypothetical protein